MDYLLVCSVSLLVAALTLFSGFGLGTLLMPAFAVFFPLEVAIAATALVHLLNNLFKLALVGRWASRRVVLGFGLPAVTAAALGAWLMLSLADAPRLGAWRAGRLAGQVEPVKLVVAALLLVFSWLELSPRFQAWSLPPRWLPLGGALSGFFGGLAGMQGALRAAFLVRAGLTRDQFIGSAAAVSALVDLTRVAVYAAGLAGVGREVRWDLLSDRHTLLLVAAACAAAFLGSYVGARLVRKVTLRTLQRGVALMLVFFALALAAGIV